MRSTGFSIWGRMTDKCTICGCSTMGWHDCFNWLLWSARWEGKELTSPLCNKLEELYLNQISLLAEAQEKARRYDRVLSHPDVKKRLGKFLGDV